MFIRGNIDIRERYPFVGDSFILGDPGEFGFAVGA